MSKLYYQALKHIPSKFIDDKTMCCEYGDEFVIANPNFEPLQFNPKTNRWRKVTFIAPTLSSLNNHKINLT